MSHSPLLSAVRPLLRLILFTSSIAASAVAAEVDPNAGLPSPANPYLSELLQRAQHERLHTDPQWLALLHYEGDLFTWGVHSHAEQADFFLSPDGARDPQAELRATLTAFFAPDAIFRGAHPQCNFIARRHWLGARLDFDPSRFPAQDCAAYDNWRVGLQASGASLIYPEGFINNPASMFGHTLLRIDTPQSQGPTEVLGHAVDFTGDIGTDGGVIYLFKGIFGAYSGYFGVNPYYQQLRRYADWENRDIWEYPLNLSDEELDFLLMHLWELRDVGFPYWFFTKNCSYQLFRLLELVRPELREENRLRMTVIPLDTVHSAVDHAGLVGEPRYRPSSATVLRHNLTLLTRSEKRMARAISDGELEPTDATVSELPRARRAAVLTIAYDELQYAFTAGRTTQAESQGKARRILLARSKLGKLGDAIPGFGKVASPRIPPHESHGTALLEVASGVRDDDAFLELRFRPALHTLLDREGGYTPNMQLRFLDARLRYKLDEDRLRLQELTLFEAVSLSPRSGIIQPFAWRFRSGFDTRRVRRNARLKDSWVSRTDIGAGLAYRPVDPIHVYLMGTALFDAGPRLDSSVSLGFGGVAGVYLNTPLDLLKFHFFGDAVEFVAGDTTTQLRSGGEARISITRNTAFGLTATYNRIEGEGWFEGLLGVGVSF